MKQEQKVTLLKKGWTAAEINKAESILARKEYHDVFFSKIVFWSALLVIVFGNVMVSLVLIPFILFLNLTALYVITGILGLMVGFLYSFLITDIGHLQRSHHIIASILVPLIAVANVAMMVVVTNTFSAQNAQHNPWVLSVLFSSMLLLPFLVTLLRNMMTGE